jgi:CHAT domain-containing protein
MQAELWALLVGWMALGAAPPAALTPEQAEAGRQSFVLFQKAQVQWNEGKQAEAVATMEKALAGVSRFYGENHRNTHAVAYWLADWEERRGRREQVAAHRKRIWLIMAGLRGAEDYRAVDDRLAWEEAQADVKRAPRQREALSRAVGLNNQAVSLYRKGQPSKAIPPARQALAIRKEVLGEKHPDYANSLINLGTLLQEMGDHKAALPRFRQALAIYEKALGQRHPSCANALNCLGTLYYTAGDHKAALPLLRRALVVYKKTVGEGHSGYALALNNLAALYNAMGDNKAALALFKQALAKEGEKNAHHASMLGNLASVYKLMGEHRAALPLFKQALAIRKEVQGEKHPDYARGLNSLAELYVEMGEHKAALPLYQQALKIYKEALGDGHPHTASSLQGLALLYRAMGDYEAALPLLLGAATVRKESLGGNHYSYAASLHNLAELYHAMGDDKRALVLLKQASAITKEALGERHPTYAVHLNNLASVYSDLGDHEAALALLKKSLALTKETMGERHPTYAIGLNNLAERSRDMGGREEALSLYRQALGILKEALGAGHPTCAVIHNNLARLYLSRGDIRAALLQSEKAMALTLASLRADAAAQSDRQQFASAERLSRRLDVRLSLMDTGAYEHVLGWKGSVMMRQRQRRLFSSLSAGSKTREAAQRLQATTRQIAALSASSSPARERLEQLTKEQERLQAELSGHSEEARAAFRAKPLTARELAEALPEGAVLVDYLFYWHHGVAHRDGKTNGVRHLVAFVSRRGKPTARIDLGPAEKVVGAVRKWRRLLLRGAGGPSGAEVKKLLWSPLEKHLAGAKVVLVSPDGALAGVPFAALPGAREGTYLIEDMAFAVVPVPQLLPEMLKPKDKKARLKPSLLVVGDVDYDRAGAVVVRDDTIDERGAPPGLRRAWARLPGTFAETAAVSKAFNGLFKGGTVLDLGKASATKAAVRKGLAGVRYAHLATHGFFAPEGIKSATAQKPDRFFGPDGVTGWHPLLLSGLVLAGANREPRPGEEDGILTALEVTEMELPKLELVVLSACETGLGRGTGGEGLLGLQRAFQVAGARSVMASLWQVDDRATQALMAEFYRVAWGTDSVVSRAEALRRAQLHVLKEGKRRGLAKKAEKLPKGETRLPPLYWAAFVLSGDWR